MKLRIPGLRRRPRRARRLYKNTGNAPRQPCHATRRQGLEPGRHRDAGGRVRYGQPHARVKLVEYGSMTCPHCARFDEDSSRADRPLCEERKGQLGIPQLCPRHDRRQRRADRAMRRREAFFPLTRALFKDQPSWEEKVADAAGGSSNEAANLPPTSNSSPPRRSPASSNGPPRTAFRRQQAMPDRRGLDQQAGPDGRRHDHPVPQFPGDPVVHDQRDDGRIWSDQRTPG